MSQGTQVRDFLHIDDAGRVFAELVDKKLTGAVNIASGIGVSLADLARAAHKRIGLGQLNLGAFPIRQSDPPRLIAGIQRLRNELEFQNELDWHTALDSCIDYWRDAVHEPLNQ